MREYTITPRAAEIGGGWKLRFIEDGEEAGGGVFPLEAYADEDDPAKAAFEDAEAEGESWTVSE